VRTQHEICKGNYSVEHSVRQPLHLSLCDPNSISPRETRFTVRSILSISLWVYHHDPTHFTAHS